jgi:hypothetical protein
MSERKPPKGGNAGFEPAGHKAEGGGVPSAAPTTEVTFDRRELDQILQVYGRMVAAGEWRDYALSFGRDVAVFAIFRRTSEVPLYRIEKRPKLRHRQGAYALLAGTGLVLKRGHELTQVLRVLDTKRLSLVGSYS